MSAVGRHQSTEDFRTLHAIRIKGFATAATVSELANNDLATTERHLADLAAKAHVQFREARALWQITAAGREAHVLALQNDIATLDVRAFHEPYTEFLRHNQALKELCGRWQLREGGINDHSDEPYDAAVVEALIDLNAGVAPVLQHFGRLTGRFARYPHRLDRACHSVAAGDRSLIAGVGCGSYHDIWMELHEDLLLTQGISRAAEGSA